MHSFVLPQDELPTMLTGGRSIKMPMLLLCQQSLVSAWQGDAVFRKIRGRKGSS
jgi:hypothetical protein